MFNPGQPVKFRYGRFDSSPETIRLLEGGGVFMLPSAGKTDVFFFIAVIKGLFAWGHRTLFEEIAMATNGDGKRGAVGCFTLFYFILYGCN